MAQNLVCQRRCTLSDRLANEAAAPCAVPVPVSVGIALCLPRPVPRRLTSKAYGS